MEINQTKLRAAVRAFAALTPVEREAFHAALDSAAALTAAKPDQKPAQRRGRAAAKAATATEGGAEA